MEQGKTVATITDPDGYLRDSECQVVMMDGALARVRPIRPEDAGALVEFHEQLSADTLYRRYFAAHPHLRQGEIDRYTQVDYRDRLALVLLVDERLVAVARYDRASGSGDAEVAFVVADAFQHLGIGTLLLEHLGAAARRQGIMTFTAETLSWNYPMQEVFRQVGFRCVERWTADEMDVSLSLAPTQQFLELLWSREVAAGRARGNRQATPSADPSPDRVAPAISWITGSTSDEVIDEIEGLACDDVTEVVVVELARLARPSRFLTRMRLAAQRLAMVALVRPAGGADPEFVPEVEALRSLWAQMGVVCVCDAEKAEGAARQALAAVRAGTWESPDTGALVELANCDPERARLALDLDPSVQGRSQPERRARLSEEATAPILTSYGLAAASHHGPPAYLPALKLTITDDGPAGLHARLVLVPGGGSRTQTRLLPLTDHDAQDMAAQVTSGCGDRNLLAQVVLRAARLVEDHADLCHVELRIDPGMVSETLWAGLWIGPPRSAVDDPYVRRLPG